MELRRFELGVFLTLNFSLSITVIIVAPRFIGLEDAKDDLHRLGEDLNGRLVPSKFRGRSRMDNMDGERGEGVTFSTVGWAKRKRVCYGGDERGLC